ncbi:hypothetical protein LCGC14_2244530 [marine sediment metagenome]|uniref:Uncharacterized protein n=1 Tax=marine sediment metagenome TaxID=412755 RepID=A0A0F9D464_9ZZZZ
MINATFEIRDVPVTVRCTDEHVALGTPAKIEISIGKMGAKDEVIFSAPLKVVPQQGADGGRYPGVKWGERTK